MKEIEVLVKINEDINKVKEAFEKFEYIDTELVIDVYYYDPKRSNLKPDSNNQLSECLRLRQKGKKQLITYKDDIFDNGKWLYSNEYETEVKSIDIIKEILNRLGLKKLLKVKNNKSTYKFNDYEIVLEDVEDLGYFMEVEYCTSDDVDIKKVKSEIQKFIDGLNLNVSEELNMGKPEMILRNKNIVVENEEE